MKPSPLVRTFLLSRPLALAALLAAPLAHAQSTLTWDANGTTALQTDGLGVWLTANQWWNGSANTTWTSGDNAIFGNGGAGGAVTLASATDVGSLRFNYFTGTYTLGTLGSEITLGSGGITKNAGAGIVTLSNLSPLKLGAAQTWTNLSATNLVFGAVNLNGNALTFSATGNFSFEGNASNVLSGAGGIIKNGSGALILDAGAPNPLHTFTGGIVVNSGAVRFQTAANVSGRGNVTLSGGYLGGRFGSSPIFGDGLGTSTTAIQIPGGTSGFSGEGGTGSTFQIGTAGSTLQWGATGENGATGFFNPAVLVLGGDQGMNANAKGGLWNAIDLNGSTRTITSLHANGDGSATTGFSVYGAITNSTGTAGLIKTGPGAVILNNTNSYTGATSIQGGSIILSSVNTPVPVTAVVGTINNTSALSLSGGGTLRLVNTAQVDRFADGAAITSTGSTISYENTSGANVYTETLGAVTHSSGQLNVVETTNQAGAGSQTLTFGGLTRSGTASVTFSAGGTGPQTSGNKNMIVVTGAGSTATGEIIGAWATTGTAANAQTDYAVFASDFVTGRGISASAPSTWSTTTTAVSNYTMSALASGTISGGSKNINTLRSTNNSVTVTASNANIALAGHSLAVGDVVTFSATTIPTGLAAGTPYYVVSAVAGTSIQVSATAGGIAITPTTAGTAVVAAGGIQVSSGNNLGTTGILNGSATTLNIVQSGGAGVVTLPTTSAGQLYVNTGSGGITINAPVSDNTGALTLVKSGSSPLILGAANNPFTGDIAVNAGILQVGVSGSNVQLNSGSYAGNIFIAAGAALTLQGNAANNLSGVISGDGNLNLNRGNTTLSGANTYTGKTSLTLVATNALGSTLNVSSFNSVVGGTASSSLGAPTTVANGTIDFGGGGIQQTATINYTGSGETTDRVINFQMNASGTRVIDSAAAGVLKFTSVPTNTSASANSSVTLQGAGNGEIVHGLPFVFANLTKSGSGEWTLGGTVGSTGVLTISANGGTLALQKRSSLMGSKAANWTAAKIIVNSGGTLALNVGGADELNNTDVTTALTNLGGLGGAITNNGLRSGSTIGFDTTNAAGGSFTIADNMANSTGTGGGAIGLTKRGTGTLVLTGTNTYTGATTVSDGTLEVAGGIGALSNTSAVTVTGGTLLLSGSAPNRINNTANFTTTAGTVRLSGGPDFTETVGSLSLGTGSSVIDFGGMSGTNVLTFAASNFPGAGTLQVWNWSGNTATGGGTDQLFFGSTAGGLTGGTSSSVEFFTGSGSGSLGFGTQLANGELVPVPEPSALLATGALGAAAGPPKLP